MVMGHEKGRNLKDRQENFFGCAHPEGYRKAMAKMRMAAKFNLPVITMIDTPGAYPGLGAETWTSSGDRRKHVRNERIKDADHLRRDRRGR